MFDFTEQAGKTPIPIISIPLSACHLVNCFGDVLIPWSIKCPSTSLSVPCPTLWAGFLGPTVSTGNAYVDRCFRLDFDYISDYILSILSLRMGSFSFLPIRLEAHLAFLKPIDDS